MENKALIDQEMRTRLERLYEAPERRYHGPGHILSMLDMARRHAARLSDPEAVDAAIWFHDAVYDSRASDNEARSADLARTWLVGRTAPERIDRIARMIEATASHELPDGVEDDPVLENDLPYLLDFDLSILGASPGAFDAYEEAIRQEYEWVDDSAWIAGRGAVLARFLERPRLFLTPEFAALEAPARCNLKRSMERLKPAI